MSRGRLYLTQQEFVGRSKIKHHNKYDYTKTIYEGALHKVIIICPVHGEFTQQAGNHVSGKGCRQCADMNTRGGLSNTIDFIVKAKKCHNDYYSYEHTTYVRNNKLVIITCPVHGNFTQKPCTHLEGRGCRPCRMASRRLSKTVRVSKNEIAWLDMLGITDRQINIPGTKYTVDGINQSARIIYEFLGDYWHGNPTKFDQSSMNTQKQQTFGELYKQTTTRRQCLQKLGYTVVEMWEADWKKLQSTK
jgi:hypothetical protein